MKLSFFGAAKQVTGSMFLLESEGYKILIDCGTDLEKRNLGQQQFFPFLPSEIDLVVLTHAHLDHSGNIPLLYLNGYKGQVLCTPATIPLTELILNDSASINYKKIKGSITNFKHDDVYLSEQVEESMDMFVPIAFNKPFEVREGIKITFITAGHLLGAANVFIEVREKGETKTIAFSGDIGRKNYPLLPDPQDIPQADYFVCESTYGSRVHEERAATENLLTDIVKSSCFDIAGRLIIPSFSVGRTQSVLYALHKIFVANQLPPIKIYTDSPMAKESSRIYEDFADTMNDEARQFKKDHVSLFDFDNLIHLETFKESKAIADPSEPSIIISSSGMIKGGRMEMHIKKNIRNPYCTILLVGYSSKGTTGFELSHGNKVIRIKGKDYPVLARIITTDIFSGHGDQRDLLRTIRHQQKLKKLFLVHGEMQSMNDLKKILESEGMNNIETPEKGQFYEL